MGARESGRIRVFFALGRWEHACSRFTWYKYVLYCTKYNNNNGQYVVSFLSTGSSVSSLLLFRFKQGEKRAGVPSGEGSFFFSVVGGGR